MSQRAWLPGFVGVAESHGVAGYAARSGVAAELRRDCNMSCNSLMTSFGWSGWM
ncbi:MAG: hypothetical protein IMY84_02090 [Chloroflexi bacterium]|nr:hypothetical protein [Chloroflexota bacterium]